MQSESVNFSEHQNDNKVYSKDDNDRVLDLVLETDRRSSRRNKEKQTMLLLSALCRYLCVLVLKSQAPSNTSRCISIIIEVENVEIKTYCHL